MCKECHIPNETLQYESSQPAAPHAESCKDGRDDIFPVPPVGYEYLDMKVAAQIENDDKDEVDAENVDTNQIEKLGYEVCN